MNRHEMRKKIKGVRDLPTLPIVAMEVNRLLRDENVPVEQLLSLLEKDQSLVSRILRLVNSSFYGFKSKVTSLRHAVTLMGFSTIQHAVVSVAVIDCLKLKSNHRHFDIARFWTHSIGVAVVCRYLAAQTKTVEPEMAFTAGLLHDIGKVVLVNSFPDVFFSVNDRAVKGAVSFSAAEKLCESYPHNLIGGYLAKHWMLPESLECVIRNHHGGQGRASGADGVLTGLVTVADTLANALEKVPGHSLHPDTVPEAVRVPVIELVKNHARWIPEIKSKISESCTFFNQG